MLKKTADVLIIGAGAYGLSCAWWMTQEHNDIDIMVLDGGGFAHGASGRHGAGMRMQWGLEFNILLCQESIRFFEEAAERLDYPEGIDFKQEGYLLLAPNEQTMSNLRSAIKIQHKFGVPSELFTPEDCLKLVPSLNLEGLAGGSFCSKDASASAFKWLDALLKASRRNGAKIEFNTMVNRIERNGNDFIAHTNKGTSVTAGKILLCTDWAVPQLIEPLGITLPIVPFPKEILVTEACQPIIGPMLVDMERHIAINQVKNGNIVFTVTRERKREYSLKSTPGFLNYAAQNILELLPGIGNIQVLRSWCGTSGETPDMQAILGETDIPNLFVAVSAYKGFMTSPAVGRVVSRLILDEEKDNPLISPLHPKRFQTGKLVPEPLTNQAVTS